MFERFTPQARLAVVAAQESARRLADGEIGTQHLLLGLIEQPTSLSGRLLAGHGLDAATAEKLATGVARESSELDEDALGAMGIDLGEVRARVEATFGPGALDRPSEIGSDRRRRWGVVHLPLSRRAKRTFELALRAAQRLHHNYIGDGHLLLGLIGQTDGSAYRIIVAAGIDPARLRTELEAQLPPDLAASAG